MTFKRERIRILICLAITTPAGFLIWRFYRGPSDNWFWYYIPDVFYVIFWSLIFFFIWPGKTSVVRIPVIVFILTCILEFLQLYKPDFLEKIRSSLIGAALIGRDFVWLQFPYYILGTALSVVLLSILAKNSESAKEKANP